MKRDENMGSYNNSYESYYSNLKSGKGSSSSRIPSASNNKNKKGVNSFIARRIVQELAGVLILFIFVLIISSVENPEAEKIYGKSKEILNKNYDFSTLWNGVKGMKVESLTSSAEEYIDKLIAKALGRETIKEKVGNTFTIPVSGEVYKSFGEVVEGFSQKTKNGVIYTVKVPGDVKSSYDGVVKKIGEDEELGQYVAIDHEGGIETKYFYLEEVNVAEGQKVKQGEKIGRIVSSNEEDKGFLFFQIFSTGQEKDPEEYIRLKHETL